MDQKKTENWTEQDWTGGCSCLLFKIKRLPKNRLQWTSCNQLQPVLGTPLKSAHFEPILKKIGPEMHVLQQKWYVTAKSDFVWHLVVVFWVLDNFYYHKNYIGSYYTLYSIFHSCFYIPNINFNWFLLVTTKMPKNWFLAVFFSPVRSIGLLGQPKIGCSCRSVQKSGLDRTLKHYCLCLNFSFLIIKTLNKTSFTRSATQSHTLFFNIRISCFTCTSHTSLACFAPYYWCVLKYSPQF